MVGQRFGSWTLISRAPSKRYERGTVAVVWNCRCDCGTERAILWQALRRSKTKSCGRCSKPVKDIRERDPHGPAKGEVAESAVHWLNGREEGLVAARREVVKAANDYRKTMLRHCKDKKYPPCMKCNDVTVAYCAETETECQDFLSYACGWGGNKKNQEG